MVHLPGRKKSKKRHSSHHGSDEENEPHDTENISRHSGGRRKKSHKRKHHRDLYSTVNSDEDFQNAADGSQYNIGNLAEDSAVAALARATLSFNPRISTAISGTENVVPSSVKDVGDRSEDGTLKEWIPQFTKHYGYTSLFRFASGVDYTLMGIGTVAAIISGCCMPCMIYMLGNLLRSQVLADKLRYCLKNSNQSCEELWRNCENSAINASNYNNKDFLRRPLLQKVFNDITFNNVEHFVEVQLTVAMVYNILSSIYFFCWSYASQNQGGKLRRAYFESLLHKDMTWFDEQADPDAINRTMENTRRVVEIIGESIPITISLIIMSTLCLILALLHGWQLTIICLGTLPFAWFTMWLENHAKATRILKERRSYRVAHDLAKEVFSNIRTVIGYGTQLTERALYNREIARGNSYVIVGILSQSLAMALMYIVIYGLWAGVIWFGMSKVINDAELTCTDRHVTGIYDTGDFFIVIMSVMFGCGSVYIIIVVVSAACLAKLCGKDVLKLIDGPNGIDNMRQDGIYLDQPLMGKVEFVNVRFTYRGKKETLVLNNLNFVAEPNTTVAIVGTSDSGKSTVLKLICKEYLTDSGFVRIDGQDIRAMNTTWLRSHIGFVTQEITLFDMSIEDNVRMGKLDANFFQIQDACIKAGAHDFIISFKEGYKTKIGHKGSRLTPGQKQQLAMARALVRQPKILLLDEFSMALDSKSVIEFMRSLQKISRNRTVILVAHRLATVVHANIIYVMKRGKVVEKGDHHTLINNEGPYSQLCNSNRASKSWQSAPTKVEGFDTSEMTIISCVKTFNPKPILPNIYNNLLNVDPVVSKVTYAILKSTLDTDRGFHTELEWTLQVGQELAYTKAKEDDSFEKGLRREKSVAHLQHYKAGPETSLDKVPTIAADSDIDEFQAISILNSSKTSWFRVLIMGSTSFVYILFGVVSTILFSIGTPLFGYLLALVIDVLSNNKQYPENWSWEWAKDKTTNYHNLIAICIATLGVYLGIFSCLQDFFLNLAGYRSVLKMRRVLYGSILNQDITFFEDPQNRPITLASILFQDTDSIRHLTLCVYATLLQCICAIVASITLCLLNSVKLAGYTVSIFFGVIIINMIDGWLVKKQHGKTVGTFQQMSALILQVLQSKHVITVCQMEPYFLSEFTKLQRKSLRTNKTLSCLRTFTYGFSQCAVLWGFIVLFFWGDDEINEGSETFLNIFINGCVLTFGLISIGNNLSIIMGLNHVSKGGQRALEVINRQPLIYANEGFDVSAEDCAKEIQFVNTHFWRHHATDTALLKGVNLGMDPLKVTAIVGFPEAGKSAYIELVARFYDACHGLVTIGGNDIRYYSANSLREHISVVTKVPELFCRTVAQNIALGATFRSPSMDDVIKAAKEANVHNVIVSLPEGYETRIGGEHDYLSSAQKQKISIARALLKNPRIIIFDEVTHALDSEGERAVLESIEMAKVNRTVIMISYHIQPVIDADWLVVMEKGYVEEQGTHQELLIRRPMGIYAQMWRSQNPLMDENFLKGTFAFSSILSKQSKSEMVSKEKKKEEMEEEEPPTPRCGGFFGFLGVVEPREDDEMGDGYRIL